MPKKIKQPSFLDRVIAIATVEGNTEKSQTAHPAWISLFAEANEPEKRTLALEWMKHFARTELPSRGDKQRALCAGMVKHKIWLEQIAPYIKAGSLTELGIKTSRLDFDHVVTGGPTTAGDSARLRTMWFGSDAEKLECLLQTLAEKTSMDYAGVAGPLSAVLAWSALALPGADKRHHAAACLASYWTGYLLDTPDPSTAPEARAWQYMGLYTKGANQFKLSNKSEPAQVAYYETIKHLPAFCQETVQGSPVEVLCRLFPRMMAYVPKAAGGAISTGALLTYNSPPGSDVYSILQHWLPGCGTQIEVARATGLTLDEFMVMLPQLITSGTDVQIPLPQDLQP